MSDPFDDDLHGLGPIIDTDAAFGSFDSTRRRRRRRRRTAGGGIGAAVAAGVGLIALATSGGTPTDDVTAGPEVRFGPALTSTVEDLLDQELDILSCLGATDERVTAIVYLEPDVSGEDAGDAREPIDAIVRSFDPNATFVSQQEARAEMLGVVDIVGDDPIPTSMFSASYLLRLDQDRLGNLETALADQEGVLEVLWPIDEAVRLRCYQEHVSDPPIEEQPLTATERPFDSGGLPKDPPSTVRSVLGGVLAVVPVRGGPEVFVVEFAPDTDWTYLDRAGRLTESGRELEDPRPVTITAVGDVEYRHCADGLGDPPLPAGIRVEAFPAGPLAPTALGSEDGETLGALAWVEISCVDVDLARELWADPDITLYTQQFEGWQEGQGIGPRVEVSAGRVVNGAGFDTVTLFDRIDAALTNGLDVRAEFNPDLGYVERLVIVEAGETLLDITSRRFESAERIEACDSASEGPLDLSAEPPQWAISGQLTRWYDADGCPIRLDIVEQTWGSGHCDMDRAQFLQITSFPQWGSGDTRRSYVFDPDGTLGHRSPEEWGYRADPAERPTTLVDTGLRSADRFEMWTDTADPERLWLIRDEELQVWRLDTDGFTFVCY